MAILSKIIRDNPLLKTIVPTPDDPNIRVLTKEEQERFCSVLSFYNTGNILAVNWATGMRIGELCALEKKRYH